MATEGMPRQWNTTRPFCRRVGKPQLGRLFSDAALHIPVSCKRRQEEFNVLHCRIRTRAELGFSVKNFLLLWGTSGVNISGRKWQGLIIVVTTTLITAFFRKN